MVGSAMLAIAPSRLMSRTPQITDSITRVRRRAGSPSLSPVRSVLIRVSLE